MSPIGEAAPPDEDASAPAAGPQRGPTSADPAEAFLGRSRELGELCRDLVSVPHPLGPVRLLCGPAGVGKTRLAQELSASARLEGFELVWAHGAEGLASPPYWPWTQIVRTLLGRDRGTDLAALVLDDPVGADRFDVFDATAAVLRGAAGSGPLLVVLDDLHAADEPSLQLTRFLARHLVGEPLLMVATVRTAGPIPDQLEEHLADLARSGRRESLAGLPVAAVGGLLGDEDRADVVHAVTGGNPLHVHELIRELRGREGGVPREAGDDPTEALHGIIARRVRAVDETARTILDAAAVLGLSFDLGELAELVAPLGAGALQDALAMLGRDGFVQVGDRGTFNHPLVAEAVRSALDEPERHRLHLAAARLVGDDEDRAGELADHLLASGPEHRREAVEASLRAGTLATRALAHEVAVEHLSRVRGVLDEVADPDLRLTVLLDLGAALWRNGRTADADDAYDAAWEVATEIGDADALARAVLRDGIEYYFTDDTRPMIRARVEHALAARADSDGPIRARLLAELASHHLGRTIEEGRRLAEEAVAMARATGDPLAIGNALIARQVADLGPSTLQRRLSDGHETLACAEETGDHRLAIHGRFLLMVALLEAGDIGALDGELRHQHEMTEELGEPRFERLASWLRATRAMADGDLAAAEVLAERTFEISNRVADPDAIGVYGGQIGVVRWVQGRVLEMEPAYEAMRAAEPHEPLWPSVLAWLAATTGRPESARGLLEAVPDPSTVTGGMHWLLLASTYAETAAAVGSDEQVEAAWDALLPYADRVIPVAVGAAMWGTAAKPLGHLALRRGDVEAGITHLRDAVRTCARMGARPWLVEAQLDLADALDLRSPQDPEARALRDEARLVAERLGLDLFLERLREASARVGTGSAATDGGATGAPATPTGDRGRVDGPTAADPEGAPTRPTVRVIGGFEVRAGGEVSRWSSRRARELLKILVSRRGQPIGREALMDMLWPGEDPVALANRLSVALSTVRRALDPDRTRPAADLVSTGDGIALDLDVVSVDVEEFLEGARRLLGSGSGRRSAGVRPGPVGDDQLQAAAAILDEHRGEALPDEPHADWAVPLREEVRIAAIGLARLVAAGSEERQDHLRAAEAHRRVLDLDPYDEAANLGLVAAFAAMGAHGRATAAYDRYRLRMEDLGVEPVVRPTPANHDGAAAVGG